MDPEVLRTRIKEICEGFPDAAELPRRSDHSGFAVNGKKFAYFLNSHHGDGVVGVTCKTLPGVQAALIDVDRERFYLPAYMHHHGWIGVRLDLGQEDWAQIEQLLAEAYIAMAPKKLAREFEASRAAG